LYALKQFLWGLLRDQPRSFCRNTLPERRTLTSLRSNKTAGRSSVPAKRFNESALGVLERPVLAWMADRLPVSLTPDHLTLIGIAGAITTAAGYLVSCWSLQWLWVACIGLVINWAGDSLDGTVARIRGIQRPRYGFFVDHTSDLFCQCLVFMTLGLSPCAHFGIACLGVIAFLMAFVYSLICVEVRNTLRITYFGFGPTEIRALLIAGNLITLRAGVFDVGQGLGLRGWFGPVTIYEIVIVILFTIAIPALLFLALYERRALAIEDPPRVPLNDVPLDDAVSAAQR
jgi:phosphatidylglycerophosphate synthase